MKKVALYSFSGNFKQSEKWGDPDPGFRGEFIAKRDGSILGYCDELYDTEKEFSDFISLLRRKGVLYHFADETYW